MTNAIPFLQQAASKLVEMGTSFVPMLIRGTIILVAGFFISRWIVRIVRQPDMVKARQQAHVLLRER